MTDYYKPAVPPAFVQPVNWPKPQPREERIYVEGYTTKDSGRRAEFANGGVRDSEAGKPRFDLTQPRTVPFKDQMLTRWAALMGRGAEKYEDRNWERFSDDKALARAKSSAFRHFMQWLNGEDDEDHAAAVFFNITAVEYIEGVLDDRWPDITALETVEEVEWRDPAVPTLTAKADAADELAEWERELLGVRATVNADGTAKLSKDRPLWTGSYSDPEPPEDVKVLRRMDDPNRRLPDEMLYRLNTGLWSWADRSEFTEDEWTTFINGSRRGFHWNRAAYPTHYRFEEVR